MRLRLQCVAILLALPLVGSCSADTAEPSSDGTWVGTITTDGDVTTVVNESGSVWGGTATLVEEASIGVEAGADEYMFGHIGTIHANDENIFVTEGIGGRFLVYDLDGEFIKQIGGTGQGPGECGTPSHVTTAPDGRIFLYDLNNRRVNVYSRDGRPIGAYPGRVACCNAMRVDANGVLWVPVREFQYDTPESFRETLRQQEGVQAMGSAGPSGPVWVLVGPDSEQIEVAIAENRTRIVPFSPTMTWAVAGPETVVVGIGDRYRYTVQHRGQAAMIVEKSWEPLPIDPEHAAWSRDELIARVRHSGYRPIPDWKWDGAEIPSQQPAYTALTATADGHVWVRRPTRSFRVFGCAEDPIREGAEAARELPCWKTESVLDVFDAEGLFLGSVEAAEGMWSIQRYFSVRGDQVVAVVEDDAGTIMVKRYRLAPPGEEH